jgi:putative component of membrane protein insertase Oxa1/YidC/SpoIIIJ protein YidD
LLVLFLPLAWPFYAAASELDLARALYAEGDWPACRIECLRVEAAHPGDPEALRLRALAESATGSMRPAAWWKRLGALPATAMVGLYRLVVAPAIGNRCVLEPSCSRYSLQAARERGWLGLPMTADRLIREPSVVAAGEKPVADARGRIRYADPVSDHVGGKAGGR